MGTCPAQLRWWLEQKRILQVLHALEMISFSLEGLTYAVDRWFWMPTQLVWRQEEFCPFWLLHKFAVVAFLTQSLEKQVIQETIPQKGCSVQRNRPAHSRSEVEFYVFHNFPLDIRSYFPTFGGKLCHICWSFICLNQLELRCTHVLHTKRSRKWTTVKTTGTLKSLCYLGIQNQKKTPAATSPASLRLLDSLFMWAWQKNPTKQVAVGKPIV